MNLRNDYTALMASEMEYALFNAMRTSTTSDVSGIELSTRGGVPVLCEPGKAASPYYNRAVLPVEFAEDGEIEVAVNRLPRACQAVELLITQQKESVSSALLAAGFVPGPSLCYLVARPGEMVPVQCDGRKADSGSR